MKNKKLNYILIPLVIIVWGAIIYRIFNTVGNEPLTYTNQGQMQLNSGNDKEAVDTFRLMLNYRDPFLGKMQNNENPSHGAVAKPVTKKAPAPVVSTNTQSVVWPSITYGGMIKNQNANKQFVFVQINGNVNIMKAGDVVNSVELLRITTDSIEVSFQNQKKYIRK